MTSGTNKVAPQNSRMEMATRGQPQTLAQGRRGSQMLRPANSDTFVGKLKRDPTKKGWVKKVDKFLDHLAIQVLLGVALFVTLFLPDLWVVMNPQNDLDILLNVVLLFFLVVFTAEVLLTSYAREEYFKSLFFYMDIIGTISIIIDLTWVAAIFTTTDGVNPGTLRAARVAKLGAKAGRLAKLTKMFKFLSFGKKDEKEDDVTPAKKISAKMGMLLSQRVAMLIMTIVMLNPFLSPAITDYSGTGFLMQMDEVASANAFSKEHWKKSIKDFKLFYHDMGKSQFTIEEPIWLKIRNIGDNCPTEAEGYLANTVSETNNKGETTCMVRFNNRGKYSTTIRESNKRYASSKGYGRYSNGRECSAGAPEFAYACGDLTYVDALFDYTEIAVEESWLSILLIIMVIVLLVGFTATFNTAVDDLVVKPISRIMEKLKKSAETVLKSVKQMTPEEEEDEDNALSETDVLEMMVNKLARIVQKSMSNNVHDMLEEHGAGGMDDDMKAMVDQYSDSRRKSDPNEKLAKDMHHVEYKLSTEDLPEREEVINSFKFDILSFDTEQTFPLIKYMFEKHGLLTEFKVEPNVFIEFVEMVQSGYKKEPQYHMWHHGCDVMHTVYQMLNATMAPAYMGKLEIFSSLISALAHDVGHPGLTNAFLVNTKDSLALLHNDKSPLENMHASTLYKILQHESANILANLTPSEYQDSRKQILTCILNTDMAFHFENLKKLEMFEEVHGNFVLEFVDKRTRGESCEVPECLADPGNRLLLQETFLHAADLSNPVKPTAVYEKWAERVMSEFFSQGDKEKELGMKPSPLCDRETTVIPNSQMGFIDFIVFPLYSTIFKLFPDGLQPLGEHLRDNYTYYGTKAIQNAHSDGKSAEDQQKIQDKIDKKRDQINDLFVAQ